MRIKSFKLFETNGSSRSEEILVLEDILRELDFLDIDWRIQLVSPGRSLHHYKTGLGDEARLIKITLKKLPITVENSRGHIERYVKSFVDSDIEEVKLAVFNYLEYLGYSDISSDWGCGDIRISSLDSGVWCNCQWWFKPN